MPPVKDAAPTVPAKKESGPQRRWDTEDAALGRRENVGIELDARRQLGG